MSLFLKGILIGLLFGVPVGAVGAAFARRKKRTESFQKMNRIFGAVLSLFGILVFIRAIPR